MKQCHTDEYETTRKEEDIGIGKDMRNFYRVAQNLAHFNAIPRWKYQKIQFRTKSIVTGRRKSDVDMTLHDREVCKVRNKSVLDTGRSNTDDVDMTIHDREVRTNSMVMGSRCNNQYISEKIELFLDSCEETMMNMTHFDDSVKDRYYGRNRESGNIGQDEKMKQQEKISYDPSRKEIKWRSCMNVDTTKKKEVRFDIENTTCI